jgi:hypothetical protein
MKFLLARDGGFFACSDAGNWSYAYPRSGEVERAKTDPERSAAVMSRCADIIAEATPSEALEWHNDQIAQHYFRELAVQQREAAK